MITAEEREKAFRQELDKLLATYRANLEIQDVSKTTHIEEWRIVVIMDGLWDVSCNTGLEDYAEFVL